MKESNRNSPFTPSEIDQLLCLNNRLSKLEHHLLDEGNRLESSLLMRVADPNDPMNDYEIEAKLYYILRKTDSAFDDDDDDDNYLTMRRYIDLKECAKKIPNFAMGKIGVKFFHLQINSIKHHTAGYFMICMTMATVRI